MITKKSVASSSHMYHHDVLYCQLINWLQQCNAPTGGVRPDVGKGVRLLGKSTGSYGKPETTRVSLVRRWTSKLGRCLTRQSKRSCSEVMMEKAISDKPSTGLRTRGSTKEQQCRV